MDSKFRQFCVQERASNNNSAQQLKQLQQEFKKTQSIYKKKKQQIEKKEQREQDKIEKQLAEEKEQEKQMLLEKQIQEKLEQDRKKELIREAVQEMHKDQLVRSYYSYLQKQQQETQTKEENQRQEKKNKDKLEFQQRIDKLLEIENQTQNNFERQMEEIKSNLSTFDITQHQKRLYQDIEAKLKVMEYTVEDSEEVCSICLQIFIPQDKIKILPCRHFFHIKCIDAWLFSTLLCPMCKQDIRKFFK